ncbi:MAG: hypothetical protein COB22_06510 [Cycloclasticus sp.]|nr:MAG: hypothetical protein COB22_06510 [Cycloclasticus sp.]
MKATIKRAPFALSGIALAVSMGISGVASADTLSIQGSWLDFQAGKDARTNAISCESVNCESTSNIENYPTQNHESNFDDTFSGSFKWTHDMNGKGLWGTDDIAIAGSYFRDKSDTTNLDVSQGGSTSARVFGTGFVPVDSSTADISSVQDDAWFVTGDVELGWNHKEGDADVRLFAGIRVAATEYERNATHNVNASSDLFDGEEKSKFFGLGPRIGASIKQPIGNSNLALTAAISGGVLFGKLEREYDVSSDTDDGSSYNDKSSNEWVPFTDAEAALAYQINDNASIEFGYQYNYQDNVILLGSVCTDSDDGPKPSNSSCSDDKSHAETHGPFIRLTFEL